MSTVSRPRGPLPRRVYWVRRLLVLGIALLLVVGIARLLGGGSDGASTDQATTVAGQPRTTPGAVSYGPTLPVPPTTPGRKKRGGRATPAATPQATPQSSPDANLPVASGPCADDDVVVTPVTGTPPAGGDVVVRLDFTTRTSLACTVAVSSETVALKITRRNGRFVWSTQRCPAALPTASVTARRDVPGSVNVVWNGHFAVSDCSAVGRWATPGWYHAVGTVLGGAETDVQWQLGPPVPATVTVTPSPTGTPTGIPSGAASGSASGGATRNPVASPGSSPTTRPTGSPR